RGTHVESAVKASKVGVREPERLIVDIELDDLSICRIDDGLPCSRQSIGFFWIHDGPAFIKSVDECAILTDRSSLLEAAAHAEIAVAQREHGFALLEQIRHESFLDEIPLVRRIGMRRGMESRSMNHRIMVMDRSVPDRSRRGGFRRLSNRQQFV